MSRAVVVLAHNRSGSQLLVRWLDSHPLISCVLGEPLHYHSAWYAALKGDRAVLDLALTAEHNAVAACKVSYAQWFKRKAVRRYIAERGVSVVHLTRDNVLAAALGDQVRDVVGYNWAYGDRPALAPVTVDVRETMERARVLAGHIDAAQKQIRRLTTIDVRYAEMVGCEGAEVQDMPDDLALRLCQWMDIETAPMTAPFFRKVSWPWPEQVSNWRDVYDAAQAAGLGGMAEEMDG